jgi:hypothetical protein
MHECLSQTFGALEAVLLVSTVVCADLLEGNLAPRPT